MSVPDVRFILAIEEQVYVGRPILTVEQVPPYHRIELPLVGIIVGVRDEQRVVGFHHRQHLRYPRPVVGPHDDVHVVVPGDAIVVPQGSNQSSPVDEVCQVGPLDGLYEDTKRPIEEFLVERGQRAEEVRLDWKVEYVGVENVEEEIENENEADYDKEVAWVEATHCGMKRLLQRRWKHGFSGAENKTKESEKSTPKRNIVGF